MLRPDRMKDWELKILSLHPESTPPESVEVKENNILYHINIAEGQKSGFYCDQRDNRRIVAWYPTQKDKNVLDCFCYTGGFTLNSLQNGARSVTCGG